VKRLACLAVLFAFAVPATAGAAAPRYAFPASWVAKSRASLIHSTGNPKIQCHGVFQVFMRAGGIGYRNILCSSPAASYRFSIDQSTGRVKVAAVA
jgi:hypothetical protein